MSPDDRSGGPLMRKRVALVLVGLIAALGCAKPKVWSPPRVDLQRHGTFGLIQFDSAAGYGAAATDRFLAAIHAAQGGVPVLELGTLSGLLEAVGHADLGPDAARAIGERYRVDVLVIGDLDIENLRPRFSIQSITEANARAEIRGQLNTRFVETRSGATIWSDEARGTRTVASFDLAAGRRPEISAVDPEGEHAQLVAQLVARATDDFRGRWVRP